MKTFDRKDVYSVLNAEDARNYIDKEGFFANTLSDLNGRVRSNKFEILDDVNQLQDYPFITCDEGYLFFLPTDKVKKVEEKKWRAFEDFNEFKIWTNKSVGSVIVYRDKLTHDELEAVITRSKLYENFVEIGAVQYTFKELFDQWEWLNPRNEWQPFGVEE